MITKKIKILNNKFEVEVTKFEKSDLQLFKNIYDSWLQLTNALKSLGYRGVNIPDGLSESLFCYFTDTVRIIGCKPRMKNNSFDAYNLKTGRRIQIKACSVPVDLTSFGPNSVWDELYFMDFYRGGNWDYSFDIYLIPNHLIYEFMINKEQSFTDMQKSGKRPRLSIKSIIQMQNIQPLLTKNLLDEIATKR